MAQISFFTLDITYKEIDNKAVIFLFGKTAKNEQVCVIDQNFLPYCYVQPKKTNEINRIIDDLESIQEEKKDIVLKTETVKKKILGKEEQLIKIYTDLPKHIKIIREKAKKIEDVEKVLEADIPFEKRYLIDKKIIPLALVDIEGEPTTLFAQKIKVPVFEAEKITPSELDMMFEPNVVAFDIEVYNPLGKVIDMDKYPIIMLSLYGKHKGKIFKKVITWKRFKIHKIGNDSLDYVEFVNNEAELIERFKNLVAELKPDILAGYFSDGFDLAYLIKRAEKNKIKLNIGLDYSNASLNKKRAQNMERVESVVSINGIVHVDIFKFIRRVIAKTMQTDFFTLDAVSQEILGAKKDDVDLNELASSWDNPEKEAEKLSRFCKYNLQDSLLVYQLTEKIFPHMMELSKIVGLPLFEVTRKGFSQLVEFYLMRQTAGFNEIIPEKPHYEEVIMRRTKTYKGAFVYEPKPGLHKNIVVWDFKSLYPTIIVSHNISPDTLNCSCCEGKDIAPNENDEKIEGTFWFCKKKKGFIPTVIEDLITRRARIKEIMKQTKDEKNLVLLDARQESLKTLANSTYGYLGFFGARWYSLPCAQSILAYARHYIHKVINEAKKSGFEVLYSDTDSIFMKLGDKTKEDSKAFGEKINMNLPGMMELGYEGFYPAGIFVAAKGREGEGAKKKYAMISEDGFIKIRGFETVRRNWSFIAKEVQEKVIEIILKKEDPKEAFDYVHGIVEELRKKKIPLGKVVIFTQLQKDISDYEAIGPHVAVAQRMKDAGQDVGPGTMIEYVITEGPGRLRDKAKLPEEVTNADYDAEYYIHNQVIPSVERIFEALGYKTEELTERKKQSKLGHFFN